ncbi:uncharacterized protein LOC117333697 [Pecten maximus]|uniref:uncharacterized protein LOC117333697 n=1 Tax=Pecten maximus TaxID=6579 RepID=UPI001458C788|nr:uncharacterized protein LOC117333697 [Pecten maximus]XP_033749009.1 uncharacterized protein LOC117333697 [Pecten maximus]
MVMFSICLAMCVWILEVRGHGRLLEPPGRASMWRFGYNSPPNYDDNQLFCGGFNRQWKINGGKCGVCGDPWDGARVHEAGGKYATGTIVRHYSEGQTISVNVQITASHKGYFEFRLCPHNNPSTRVSQACLDQHVLQQTDGSTRVNEAGHPTNYTIHLKLPAGVTCSQCLLQWKYNAGNSYGCDGSHCCIGCGEQEQFYGCADVSVGSAGSSSYSSGQMPSSVHHPVNVMPQGQTQPSGVHLPSSVYRPINVIPQGHPQSSGQITSSVYRPINVIPQGHPQSSGQISSSVYRPINFIPQGHPQSSGQISSSVYRPINFIPHSRPQSSGIHFLLPAQQGQSIHSHKPAGYVPQNTYHVISGTLFSGGSHPEPCKATPRYRAIYQYADQYCAVQCRRGHCPAEQYCTSACRRLTGGK